MQPVFDKKPEEDEEFINWDFGLAAGYRRQRSLSNRGSAGR